MVPPAAGYGETGGTDVEHPDSGGSVDLEAALEAVLPTNVERPADHAEAMPPALTDAAVEVTPGAVPSARRSRQPAASALEPSGLTQALRGLSVFVPALAGTLGEAGGADPGRPTLPHPPVASLPWPIAATAAEESAAEPTGATAAEWLGEAGGDQVVDWGGQLLAWAPPGPLGARLVELGLLLGPLRLRERSPSPPRRRATLLGAPMEGGGGWRSTASQVWRRYGLAPTPRWRTWRTRWQRPLGRAASGGPGQAGPCGADA